MSKFSISSSDLKSFDIKCALLPISKPALTFVHFLHSVCLISLYDDLVPLILDTWSRLRIISFGVWQKG
jgi:hypothetical protein